MVVLSWKRRTTHDFGADGNSSINIRWGSPDRLYGVLGTPNYSVPDAPLWYTSSTFPSALTGEFGTGIAVWVDAAYWSPDWYAEQLLAGPRAVLGDRLWNNTLPTDGLDDFYKRMDKIGKPPGYAGPPARSRTDDGKPSHYYPFDDVEWLAHQHQDLGSGSNHAVQDMVGDRHGLTKPNFAELFDAADAKAGQSLVLNKHAEIVELADIDIPAPWSFSLWVKRVPALSSANDSVLFGSRVTVDRTANGSVFSPHQANWFVDADGEAFSIELRQGTTGKVGISDHQAGIRNTFDYTLPLNQWKHLTMVATADSTRLYIDGAAIDTIDASIPLPRKTIGGLHNGNYTGLRAPNAKLDELRIWDEALSARTVKTLHESYSDPNLGSLVHRWAFDEASGTVATDTGTQSAPGAINGAARVAVGRVGGSLEFGPGEPGTYSVLEPTGSQQLCEHRG